jgi:dihydrofolate reductase
MRKLVASAMVSLDGVMQAPGGPQEDPTGGFEHGGWSFAYFDEAGGQAIEALFAEPFDLLLGRKTYEIFAAYWPYQGDHPIAVAFNKATKYVATRAGALSFEWENTTPMRGDAVGQVAELKKTDGRRLLTQGSANLLQSLHGAGLIDEYRVMIFPCVLGKGKRLFEEGSAAAGLRLQSSSATPSGVILNSFTPAGAIPPGSHVDGPPSQAELKRRKAWGIEG